LGVWESFFKSMRKMPFRCSGKIMAKKIIAYVTLVGVVIVVLVIIMNYPFYETLTPNKYNVTWNSFTNLVSNAEKLEVEYYVTGERVLVDKGDPVFNEVLNLLKSSTLRKVTRKTIVIGNGTGYVTIPYPYCYLLTFELRNGTKLKFNLIPEGTIWFEIKEAIFEVKVDPKLVRLVRGILSRTKTNLTRQEVYREGLKLLVTLSSTELKCGETLTVRATLLNVNNTANITIAAGLGGINLVIYDSQDNIVYAVRMVNPGPTPPYPLFKSGQKMSCTFKWDTSKKVLHGNTPPPPGRYYIEVEAYVTDLDAHSKLVLKTGRIEVKLLEN